MKRMLGVILITIVLMLGITVPASADSLGISPSHIEVEIPQGSSAPVNFQVHYFSGDLRVSLVDIPLEVETAVIHVSKSPENIVVIIRDSIMAPQEYNGYVKFSSMSQATVTLAVNIKAKVTVGLSANIVEPSQPSAGGSSPSTYDAKTDLFGTEGSFRTDSEGEVLRSVEATSEDGALTVSIPKGTMAQDKDGNRLKSLGVAIDESPPDPPEDADVIGLAYDFGPDGATFDPALTLTWTYDPADLPDGVAPEDLVLAYYDEDTQSWVELECTVDTETMTVTAIVSHFTSFALLCPVPKVVAPPAAPAPAPEPPAPTPPVIVPEPVPAPPEPAEEPVLPPAPTPPAPAPAPAPAPELFPWHWFWVGLAVFVIAILALILRRQRRG